MDLENFWPISKSRKQMGLEVSFSGDFWASESRILMPTGLGVSDLSCFVLFFSFSVFWSRSFQSLCMPQLTKLSQ